MSKPLDHTITALVADKPGVLAKVSGMFRRRGFNIANLAVGHSETPHLSRMTFVVQGDESVLEQVTKQLYKLVDVVHVSDIPRTHMVSRELALIKIGTTESNRDEAIRLVHAFSASIMDEADETLIIEVTGDEAAINSLIGTLERFDILEIMRTGRVAIKRGGSPIDNTPLEPSIEGKSAPDVEAVP